MTYYIKSGNTFSITAEDNIDIRQELPVGTYMVSYSMDRGYFLTKTDDLEVKGKVYGDLMPRAERIMSTFDSRPRNTGVLLNGEKGSGKTLLAKKISELCRAQGIATIIVNQGFCGDGFNALMQGIDQASVIIFDEFEKVYEPKDQEKILTLLDGVFPSKKLFLLTVNNMAKVDQFMLNRPGRLFYSIQYEGLTRDFILEFCNDVLINKDHSVAVANLASLFKHFNFDMLQSLVEEMNRYGETPKQALDLLNVKPDAAGWSEKYKCTFNIPGWSAEGVLPEYKGNIFEMRTPIASEAHLSVWSSKEQFDKWHNYAERRARSEAGDDSEEEDHPEFYREVRLTPEFIKEMDGNGSFRYVFPDGVEVLLKKQPYSNYDYTKLL